ncbi:MAG: capsule biosynthesis protein [Betaproteobacteria bacterium]|nr:capsule biosynthesis protein [Betaproteobacteria bacterium]NBY13413.1 capsule biosynthesis protein [Betaproteobacteria bacterium]
MTDKLNVVFVSLAQNQSRFFEMVGKSLAQAGHGIVHVCFHEGAVRELRGHGCEALNPYEYQVGSTDQVHFDDYGIHNPALLLGHEKAAYELSETKALERKFKGHLTAMDTILRGLLERGGRWCVVQELGGFTSVLAAYFAARRHSLDNWFIEPSFFRGRLFFTPNTFSAPIVTTSYVSASDEVRATLEQIVKSQSVVVPAKDRLHYRKASKKLLDFKNYRRLLEKSVSKYVHGEKEEFEHIGGHVARHLRMYINSRRNARYYSDEMGGQSFIYYPLHVPADFALTIRSPEYLDQYSLIDYLCRVAPLGYRVVIKEHPALVGAVSPARIGDLLARHDNLMVLSPALNNHEVLAAADAVVTVNSKSGAEALLHGTPVVVLGNAFYEDCPLVQRVAGLAGLQDALARALDPATAYDSEAALAFFQAVWDASCPGELYDLTSANVELFAHSLGSCIAK